LVVAIAGLHAGCWRNAPMPAPPPPARNAVATPPPSYAIRIIATRGKCVVVYPDGSDSDVLELPAGRPVRLLVTSPESGLHVEIASAHARVYVDRGRTTAIDLHFTRPGRYYWRCPVEDPRGRPSSLTTEPFYVESPTTFEYDLHDFEDKAHPQTLADRIALGRTMFERKGCSICHPVARKQNVGPPLASMWGKTVTLADGTHRTIDAAYMAQAIVAPDPSAWPGYPPSMPSYKGQLTDAQVDALVQYIHSLAAP
jgi:cytochrome c oxidase subunit 2